jgi:hypothetical protein
VLGTLGPSPWARHDVGAARIRGYATTRRVRLAIHLAVLAQVSKLAGPGGDARRQVWTRKPSEGVLGGGMEDCRLRQGH